MKNKKSNGLLKRTLFGKIEQIIEHDGKTFD
jgi:hypothetical protein